MVLERISRSFLKPDVLLPRARMAALMRMRRPRVLKLGGLIPEVVAAIICGISGRLWRCLLADGRI